HPPLWVVRALVLVPGGSVSGVRQRARVDGDRGSRRAVLVGGRGARVPAGLRRDGAVRDRARRIGGGPRGQDRDPARGRRPVRARRGPADDRGVPPADLPDRARPRRRGPDVHAGRATPMIYDGLRVLDATHDLAGAYCSKLLTDLGADVVAVDDLPAARRELFTYLRTSQTVGAGPDVDRAGFDVVLGGLDALDDTTA